MFELMRFFVQMALLRRSPQELPYSPPLMQALLAGNLALGLLLAMTVYSNLIDALGATALDLGVSAALLFAGLQVRKQSARWLQAFSAVLGLGLIASLAMGGGRVLAAVLGMPALAGLIDVMVYFWMIVALGHVLRHAFDLPLPFGILIVFAYTMFLAGLIGQWFPPELAAQAAH